MKPISEWTDAEVSARLAGDNEPLQSFAAEVLRLRASQRASRMGEAYERGRADFFGTRLAAARAELEAERENPSMYVRAGEHHAVLVRAEKAEAELAAARAELEETPRGTCYHAERATQSTLKGASGE